MRLLSGLVYRTTNLHRSFTRMTRRTQKKRFSSSACAYTALHIASSYIFISSYNDSVINIMKIHYILCNSLLSRDEPPPQNLFTVCGGYLFRVIIIGSCRSFWASVLRLHVFLVTVQEWKRYH